MYKDYGYNKNGIFGRWSHSGSHFGADVTQLDGTTRFQTGLPLFVPYVCLMCWNYDPGEYEEGSLISGPYCGINLWFPTRKGTCKRVDPRTNFYYLWIEAQNLRHDMEVAQAIDAMYNYSVESSI